MEDDVISINIGKDIFSPHGRIRLEITASIRFGELVALFGESGAGKTTLLRILAGLDMPDKGKIMFGREVWFDSEKNINLPPRKRKIGYMFQDYALFPNMTVFENIWYAQPLINIPKIEELMQSFGLSELANRKPAKLSGGQKQRVALARVLASEPRFLLLDEPLAALDSDFRTSSQNLIKQAHHQFKTTTIMVSHDLAEVFRMADNVVCLENGKVSATGNPMQVFANNNISGKVQITGQVVNIEPHDFHYLLTIVTGINQIIKVVAFENDIADLKSGDQVLVYTKAFNPVIMKI